MTRHLKLFLLLFSLSFLAKAQLSNDLTQFSNDLEDYIQKSGNKSAQEAVADFIGFYTANRFTNPQKIQIIKLTNMLVDRNTGITVFDNYLRAMNGLVEANQLAKFDKWHKGALQSYTNNKESFISFCQISKNVFQDHVIYKTGVMTWNAEHAEVEMDLKSDQLAFSFTNLDLTCVTPGDTVLIKNTNGKYYPETNEWSGKGGTYWWSRVGIDSAVIYADMVSYTITFSNGNIKADTAILHYPALFKELVPGTLVDRPMAQSAGNRSMYPQFLSHKSTYTGISFGKGKLSGSFGLKGRVLVGKGGEGHKAELTFAYRNKTVFKMLANEFMVRGNRVGTKKAEFIMYIDKDSIYHPQVEFSYLLNEDKFQIYRNDEGISMAPFYDTYHNIEFYCDQITWDLINPKVDLDMINDNEPAKFESVNYFRDLRYERVQGILDYHPLHRIKLYCDKYNVKQFSLADYAPLYKSNISDLRTQMIGLHDRGYVNFDTEKDIVYVKRKLFDYVNAHFGKTDFDAIAFFSIIKRYPNASISLINNDLQVQGVPRFQFSDSQNVYIVPKDQILTLKKNRNMDLSGHLRAGKVDFYGSGFAFDYHTFQVRLNNVDSLKFYYHDDKTGSDLPVKSALQNVFGTLAIDHPNNKSGRKRYPGYPVFKSDVGSKIYYDKPTTQEGVYDRNKFYFDVDPFTIDSLNDLNFETLSLDGTLISGGIMPDIRYVASMQPDKSLGFVIAKNELGYPLYGDKGKAFVTLSLSDEGFFGNGELKYLSSTATSNKFIFLLDSMNANCSVYQNERTIEFPQADAVDVFEHWMPYHDTMYVYNTASNKTIEVFNSKMKLDGALMHTPHRMAAKGIGNIKEAQLVSQMFWLKPEQLLADTSNFRLIDYKDSTKFAFYSGSVNAMVDFVSNKGRFVFNDEGVNTKFNYNFFSGSFKLFNWNMEPRTLEFESKQEAGKDISYLLSDKVSHDSLKFITGSAMLDLKDFTLYASKIPYIAIGDGWVYPDSNKVVIRNEANIDELINAKIIADSIDKFHTIDKVRMTINGRFSIFATGKYQYTDKDKKRQQFFLDEITVDEKHHLTGKTNIPDSANFYVGNHISFRGNAMLKSYQKNLEYAGFFLPRIELPYPKTDWFKGSAVINPDSVYLTVDTVFYNLNRQVMFSGINISNDSTHVYPLFFSRKRNASDPELIKAGGTFTYDDKLGVFKLGSYDKVFGNGITGNYLELSPGKKNLYTEGKFKLGFEGSHFEIASAGNAVYNFKDTSYRMKLLMTLQFPFPDAALKLMTDTIINQSSNAPAADFDEQMLAKALPELIKEKKNSEKIDDAIKDRSLPMVDEMMKVFTFSNVNFKWNPATRSMVSEGEISLSSIGKNKLERKFYGRIEITRKRAGDDFVLYLQTPEGSWYYFKYQRGVLYAVSSDFLYNQSIKDNFDKLAKKEPDFEGRVGNMADRNRLVRNMKTGK